MVTGNHITTLEWSSWLQVIISQHWNGHHGYRQSYHNIGMVIMVTGNHITTLEWSSWLQVIISQHWNGHHGYR